MSGAGVNGGEAVWAHWRSLSAVLNGADWSSMEPVKHEVAWWERRQQRVGVGGSRRLDPIGGSRWLSNSSVFGLVADGLARVNIFFFFLVVCGLWVLWSEAGTASGQDWQMGFVGCWVKGLWFTGNLLVAWYVWVLRNGFLMLVWQRCREGILKVAWWLDFWRWKIYDESFFCIFVFFCLVLDWLVTIFQIYRCLLWCFDRGQPEQNPNNRK